MRQLLVMGSLAGMLCFAASAEAGERPWYLGLEGGVEFDGDGSSSDNGWGTFATIGSGITSHISLEAELGYRATTVSAFAVDIDQTSLMFNAIYEAPLGENVSVALGLGVGGEAVSYSSTFFFFGTDEEEVELAAQVKLGLNIAVSDSTDLVANYRYMSTLGDLDITNSTLTVGVRFAL